MKFLYYLEKRSFTLQGEKTYPPFKGTWEEKKTNPLRFWWDMWSFEKASSFEVLPKLLFQLPRFTPTPDETEYQKCPQKKKRWIEALILPPCLSEIEPVFVERCVFWCISERAIKKFIKLKISSPTPFRNHMLQWCIWWKAWSTFHKGRSFVLKFNVLEQNQTCP